LYHFKLLRVKQDIGMNRSAGKRGAAAG
jgi:hypothetical protein